MDFLAYNAIISGRLLEISLTGLAILLMEGGIAPVLPYFLHKWYCDTCRLCACKLIVNAFCINSNLNYKHSLIFCKYIWMFYAKMHSIDKD